MADDDKLHDLDEARRRKAAKGAGAENNEFREAVERREAIRAGKAPADDAVDRAEAFLRGIDIGKKQRESGSKK